MDLHLGDCTDSTESAEWDETLLVLDRPKHPGLKSYDHDEPHAETGGLLPRSPLVFPAPNPSPGSVKVAPGLPLQPHQTDAHLFSMPSLSPTLLDTYAAGSWLDTELPDMRIPEFSDFGDDGHSSEGSLNNCCQETSHSNTAQNSSQSDLELRVCLLICFEFTKTATLFTAQSQCSRPFSCLCKEAFPALKSFLNHLSKCTYIDNTLSTSGLDHGQASLLHQQNEPSETSDHSSSLSTGSSHLKRESRKMPSHPPDAWAQHREQICKLYVEQNFTLQAVQEIMSKRHGFSASERQYRSQFKRWGCQKRITKEEINHILIERQKFKHKASGRNNRFIKRRGDIEQPIPEERIRRWEANPDRLREALGNNSMPVPSHPGG